MRLAPITAPLLRYALPTAALLLLGVASVLIVQTRPDATPVEAAVTPAPAPGGQGGVSGAGVVEPASELIAIGTPVSAVVASVAVTVGERVAAGSVLFTLDTREAEAELAVREGATRAAERAIASAVVERNRATAELDRYRAIADARAMTAEELSRREFALKAAEALVAQRRAEAAQAAAARQQAATRLALHTVRAPMAAEVLQVRLRPGQFAAAGVLAEPLMTLGGSGALRVRVDIDEADIGRLRTDLPARVSSRGIEKAEAVARFLKVEPLVIPKRSLTNAASERVDTRVLQVIYQLPEEPPQFYVGQQVDAFIAPASEPGIAAPPGAGQDP